MTTIKQLGLRRWTAWKLSQLSYRILNTEYQETLTVRDPDGNLIVEWLITGDAYGSGVFSQTAPGLTRNYQIDWDDGWPDWMHEDTT